MKRNALTSSRALVLILLLCGTSLTIFSQNSNVFSINESPLPAPTSPVMDFAGVLDPAVKQSLEKRIIAFRDSTNPRVELAVAIVDTTGERDIFDYSLAVARGWKIGSKEQDNPGALLFIAVKDRRYFTQISRDLEGDLPDGLAGQLQRQHLVPAFKQGNYSKGVSDTIDAYIRTIQAKQSGIAPPAGTTTPQRGNRGSVSICNLVVCLIILFVFILPILGRGGSSRNNRNDRDRWGGGGGGFGGGGSALPLILGAILGGMGRGGGGSSSGGWGSGGGGGGWGGFGGGGDFGGGGSGGGW